ncbi:hypothetical protein [Paenisporosarcina sp. TG20]|uniref:hypothetical protein n=1 Tax=Paenisporosarcina sp. TG20 TaxID=1211706 RepID=UPI0002DAC97A|nr:hypothetical protein [Paenisporosarcina sp. TG20]
MSAPSTYSEWIDCFEQFKEGKNDELVIQAMEKGTIVWTKGVAERLTSGLYEVLNIRLRHTADHLQKELNNSRGNETAIVKGFLTARNRLTVLRRVANLPPFPEEVRDAMCNLLHEYAKNTQKTIEESAASDRTGRLSSIFRNNAITRFDQIENTFSSPVKSINKSIETNATPTTLGQKSIRRRVILP